MRKVYWGVLSESPLGGRKEQHWAEEGVELGRDLSPCHRSTEVEVALKSWAFVPQQQIVIESRA